MLKNIFLSKTAKFDQKFQITSLKPMNQPIMYLFIDNINFYQIILIMKL